MKRLAIAGCILGAAIQLHAQGYIVPNGVVALPPSGGVYAFDVIQNPNTSDYTGFVLNNNFQSANVFKLDIVVDEGVRIFSVSQNNLISAQTISSGTYTEWTALNTYTLANGVPFMLGLYTGYGYTGTYTDPVFGWAKLENMNGTIQMLDSGIAYGSSGIYAGTLNLASVPEPGTYALCLFGIAGLFGYRKWFKATA